MSNQESQLEQTPDFKPKLPFPPAWLELKSDDEKWMLEKQSVLEQQGEHMMRQNIHILKNMRDTKDRLDAHELLDAQQVSGLQSRIGKVEDRILTYDTLKTKMSGGQLVIVWILRVLAALGLTAFAGATAAWFLKEIK